ncbi:hypothetical protein [Nocardioides perillae]|uniref:Uncharacterized protein n=1 Tax=Nocardioides perillae TaxID=1119534 RepID=A0A7Y9RX43_9ACTN|nr:hypothetical protein [Nocardioides perillae]NYG55580.1 hypothetical protein [Nocardioides perillae]
MTTAVEPGSPGDLPLTGGTRIRSRSWWALFAAGLVAAAGWYAAHPAPLPSDGSVAAQTAAGTPVTLGVLSVDDRAVELREVGWDRSALGAGDELTAHVCRGGSVSATRDPSAFCTSVVPAEGTTLRPGDQLVLEVVAEEPGRLVLEGLRVAYRDGWQWGEQQAGRTVEVVITER